MISEKFPCLFILLLTLCRGNFSLNSTQSEKAETALNTTSFEKGTSLHERLASEGNATTPAGTDAPPQHTTVLSELPRTGNYSKSVNKSEIFEIFHGVSNSTGAKVEIAVNSTIISDCVNVTCVEQSWNETAKTNYTLMAEAVEALNPESAFRLEKSAAIAAGAFLVSAILGYLSCVGYRHFLQRKYGNSQILMADEVYDTTDLRYFEI